MAKSSNSRRTHRPVAKSVSANCFKFFFLLCRDHFIDDENSIGDRDQLSFREISNRSYHENRSAVLILKTISDLRLHTGLRLKTGFLSAIADGTRKWILILM
jgi:hypothetical protein